MSKRPQDCIICGKPTETGEHVFPSALGGRRKDKGIYCKKHNHALGPHVDTLQTQLAIFNALLRVKPHRGDFKPAVILGSDDESYSIDGTEIGHVPDIAAILNEMELGTPSLLEIDPAHIPALKKHAKQIGLTLTATKTKEPLQKYVTEPYRFQIVLGGDDGMRSIAYLALTFVAHYWRDVARLPALAAIKDMLRSGDQYQEDDRLHSSALAGEFVYWSSVIESPPEAIHPTKLGHTIVICISRGRLLAYVSLLDALTFIVSLGDVGKHHADRTVIVHVDPLEENFGNDWKVLKLDHALINGFDRNYFTEDIFASGHMQDRMETVIRRVMKHCNKIFAEDALEEFRSFAAPGVDRAEKIRIFLEKRSQRLVNHIVRFSRDENQSNPIGALVKASAKRSIEGAPLRDDGLTEFGAKVLAGSISTLRDKLMDLPEHFPFSDTWFIEFFDGDVARAFVATQLVCLNLSTGR
ncbi:HNH endonuclease [Stenotrophomonas sp. RAC2]|uniref:HNH endonuclease n=1 Tax=Stenotrophomonas sp. RAC2 TaxID=3064902 RepID=UPI0027264F65|nr:HNH endonuclease [Stenotrophomonas sp. RAC2]MDV9043407.1 HNH endonuclease [Stenotrophomonas sp. RAC2]